MNTLCFELPRVTKYLTHFVYNETETVEMFVNRQIINYVNFHEIGDEADIDTLYSNLLDLQHKYEGSLRMTF